jgi:two-component system phosphate regulon sensor histidine kinase PhoR
MSLSRRLIAMLAAPGVAVIVLVAASLGGFLDPFVPLGVLTVVTAAFAVVLWRGWQEAARLRAAVEALESGGTGEQPGGTFARAVLQPVLRLQKRHQARERWLAIEAQAALDALDALHDPVLLLAEDRTVLRVNDAASRLFGARLLGRDLAEGLRQPELLAAVDAVLAGAADRTAQLAIPVPIERAFEVRIRRFDRSGEPEEPRPARVPAALVSLYDLTAIRRSERMRADFVTNASHEMRTPLASLIGFIETLRGPARDDAVARDRFLSIMQQQAERMSRLVNDLLSLSRIELDEHVAPTEPVDLGVLLRGVADALELRAAGRRMRFVLDIADDLPPVPGDADQLHQVMQNLAANAIAYGRPETPVTIRACRAEGGKPGVTVAVEDQGEGIPRHHLPRLTERFYRVDPARSRAIGGTGLGLAIVKHIVNRHRGRLEIDSEVGQGSIFTVYLPAVEPTAGARLVPARGSAA